MTSNRNGSKSTIMSISDVARASPWATLSVITAPMNAGSGSSSRPIKPHSLLNFSSAVLIVGYGLIQPWPSLALERFIHNPLTCT